MIYKQYIHKQSIVFNRWSRKAWSLFSALGKHITIGVLSSNISNMAYQKMMILGSFISTHYNAIFTLVSQSFESDSGHQITVISTFFNRTIQVMSFDANDKILYVQNFTNKGVSCFK